MADKNKLNDLSLDCVSVLAVALLLFKVFGSLQFFAGINDFPEYSSAGRLLLQGQAAHIYDLNQFFAAERAQFPGFRGVGLFVPPFAVPLLVPLSLIPNSLAPVIWSLVLLVALAGSCLIFKRTWRLSARQAFWIFGLTALTGPAFDAVRIGQLAPLLLLALTMMGLLLQRGRQVWAGLVFALLLLKPQQMLPLMLFLLGAGQYRLLAATVSLGVVLVALSLAAFGIGGYEQYLALIKDPANAFFMQPELNPTIRGQLLRVCGTGSIIPGIGGGVGTVVAAVFVFVLGRRSLRNAGSKTATSDETEVHASGGRWQRARDLDTLILGMACALPLGLLTSMHCHDYDLLLLMPGIVAAFLHLGPLRENRSGLTSAIVLAAVALYSQPAYDAIHYGYLINHGVFNPYFVLLLFLSVWMAIVGWRLTAKNDP